MRLLILTVSFWALASAKPEMYKEKEDFQFSRSSSDDGSKSGYYGAQRGNMGGNYEKAHNMDSLAQHQMSTLVRQVDGELGEAANTRTGSVFTSGNSRGIYGSGNYDLSNLKGRNFQESTSYDDLYASSLLSQNSARLYSANNNARYSNTQQASEVSDGYHSGSHTSQYAQVDNQQAESQYRGSSSYEYGNQGASQYKYYTHGGSQAINEYDQSNAHLQSGSNYNAYVRPKLVSATPVRVYVRPGTRITIPVAAQTYDSSQSSLTQDHSVVNTGAEVLSNAKVNIIKPLSVPKHYESSYSYHKEWEKHVTNPVPIIPTENPFPENSELHEDIETSGEAGQQYQSGADSINTVTSNSNKAQSRNLNSAYSSGYSSSKNAVASNRLRYISQTQNLAAVDAASNAYNIDTQSSGASSKLNSNLNVQDLNTKPKSYQSSYSYHKSWERRGDPYVIKPVGSDLSTIPIVPTTNTLLENSELHIDNAQLSRATGQVQTEDEAANILTSHIHNSQSSNLNSAYSSGYNANIKSATSNRLRSQMQNTAAVGAASNTYKVDAQSLGDLSNLDSNLNALDINSKPKSYQSSYSYHKSWERRGDPYVIVPTGSDLGTQMSQRLTADSSNQGVHSYGHYGSQYNQHSYSQDDCVEERNRKKRSYDMSQYQQNVYPDSPEQLGQQSIHDWDYLGQQTQNQWGNLEGQQTQNSWGDLGSFSQHQSQIGKLEDLGQQTQNTWDHLDNMGQQIQTGQLEDLGQQTQNTWDHLDNMGQQIQTGKLEDLGQQTQNTWDHLDNIGQQTQTGKLEDLGQQTQNTWDHLDNMGQQIQTGKLEDLGQQTQNTWDHLDIGQQTQTGKLEDLGQQTQNTWDHLDNMGQQIQTGKLEDLGQQTQNTWDHLDNMGQQIQTGKLEDLGQQTQNTWDHLDNMGQQIQTGQLEDLGQQTQNTWDHLDNMGQQIQTGKLEDLGQQTQNTWDHLDNIGQQTQTGKLEDLGQQTQNTWDHLDNMGQQIQTGKLEDLGQQTQNTWDHLDIGQQTQTGKLEDLGQQTQNTWDHLDNMGQQIQTGKLEDLGQQTQNTWDHLDNIGQQTQTGKLEDLGQQTQNTWDHLDNMGQQIQTGKLEDLGQQTQNTWDHLDNMGQQIQTGKLEDLGQQTQNTWDHLDNIGQQTQTGKLEDLGQQTQNTWDHLDEMGQQIQGEWSNFESLAHQTQSDNVDTQVQQTQNQWDKIERLIPQTYSKFDNQETQSVWNKVEDTPQETRKQEDQKQVGLENFANENIATQQHLNFWNSMKIHKETQHNFHQENIQANNEQNFYQQDFNSWPHSFQAWTPNSDISTLQETANGKETTLWHAVDKIIEESEKHEKNENSTATSNDNYHKISNTNYMPNTETIKENGKTMTAQSHKNNQNLFEHNDTEDPNISLTDIGRGDIGPEDIHTVPLGNNNKIHENSHSTPKVFVGNNIENKQENPIPLDVIGLQEQHSITSSTSKPKLQSLPNQYTTEKYEVKQIPDNIELQSEDILKNIPKMENKDIQLTNNNFEQQNINQKFDEVQIEVTTKLSYEYHQKSRSHTFENIEAKSNVNDEVVQPVEVTTAKTGFWKSVWGKTVSAKDKVVSWFQN